MSNHSPNLQAGLGRLSRELGRIIDTPAQAKARAREESRRRDRSVQCPRCHALKGQPCKARSGSSAAKEHQARLGAVRAAEMDQ